MEALGRRVVETARRHLGTDCAWLAEFAGDQLVVVATAGSTADYGLEAGGHMPLAGSFCARPAHGPAATLVVDARTDRAARRLAASSGVPVGAYVSVPVRLGDGAVYGVLCCLSRDPLPGLGWREVDFLRAVARVVGDEAGERGTSGDDNLAIDRIRGMLDGDRLAVELQPIVDLGDGRTVGVEALARFRVQPARPPNLWFAEAARVGLGVELELAAIERALATRPELPVGAYLSVNVSPEVIVSPSLLPLLGDDAAHVVLELTEHVAVEDYSALSTALGGARRAGVRLAIDDAGAGFASLRHVIELAPDIIKIDAALTREVGSDPVHDALAGALVAFARQVGATLVAEAIETPRSLVALRDLGVDCGQGYLIAAPGTPADLRDRYPVTVSWRVSTGR